MDILDHGLGPGGLGSPLGVLAQNGNRHTQSSPWAWTVVWKVSVQPCPGRILQDQGGRIFEKGSLLRPQIYSPEETKNNICFKISAWVRGRGAYTKSPSLVLVTPTNQSWPVWAWVLGRSSALPGEPWPLLVQTSLLPMGARVGTAGWVGVSWGQGGQYFIFIFSLNLMLWVFLTVRMSVIVPHCWISSFRTPLAGGHCCYYCCCCMIPPH